MRMISVITDAGKIIVNPGTIETIIPLNSAECVIQFSSGNKVTVKQSLAVVSQAANACS